MTKEEKFVVNPLEKYFLDPKRSGARWTIKHRPGYGTSATGYDLQVERKNQVLLIEAKYIRGSFAAALAGLVIAPLTSKQEKMKSKKKKSWSAVVCWAIGCGYQRGGRAKKYKMSGIYQILFDCLGRNLKFWECYSDLLRVKYVFFVDGNKVGKISFYKIINFAKRYKSSMDKSLHQRRTEAEKLAKGIKFK
ncbi:MAG: hypothetical protein A2945_04875 [Candidatus Liptonbacteria bacterium RIFCSPLOWO2_01_FULL_52_25]|uniref:Uncharacterized protein n=1 Tax=Candidatus Liptonbacteria bacterium RIFCSPLOWO2_01_FULL_52_25 TaxID=1798650 RepID=A0A1G2CFT5_9BACT|nr:MAG: hypothetical protein A2945_04875 [Candidatus Liptonbacteria bacterium RIFCSPLOWO2_01_FULL_52_25]